LATTSTQLFVCDVSNVASANGGVYLYALPLTAASTPAVTITTGVNIPEGCAVDAAGNLYVGNLGNGVVTVYAPPFSAASAPTVSLTVTGASIFAIAIGP
jgi:sugar lactone lactonase YvrE